MKAGRRRAIQLVEEAVLLAVSLTVLALFFVGTQSVFKRVSELTADVWNIVSKALKDMFGFLGP